MIPINTHNTLMTVLILGATGATGKHLTRCLLDSGHTVKAIVRSEWKGRMPVIYNREA